VSRSHHHVAHHDNPAREPVRASTATRPRAASGIGPSGYARRTTDSATTVPPQAALSDPIEDNSATQGAVRMCSPQPLVPKAVPGGPTTSATCWCVSMRMRRSAYRSAVVALRSSYQDQWHPTLARPSLAALQVGGWGWSEPQNPHGDFMSQHQQFDVLGRRRATKQYQQVQ
jgi:hypothetical protein